MDIPTIYAAPFGNEASAQHHAENYDGTVVEDGEQISVVYLTHADAEQAVCDGYDVRACPFGVTVHSEDL